MKYIIPDLEFILFDYLGVEDVINFYELFSKNIDIYLKKYSYKYFDTKEDMSKELKWVFSLKLRNKVTKSDFQEHFKITQPQIKKLKHEFFYLNNCFGNKIRLYDKRDLAKKCFERHTNLDGLVKYKNKLKKRREERKRRIDYFKNKIEDYKYILDFEKDNYERLYLTKKYNNIFIPINLKNSERMERKIKLTNELSKMKLEIINNNLCNDFIYRNIGEIDIITRKLCEKKYLYDYCNLDKIYENFNNNFDNWVDNMILTYEDATMIALSGTLLGRFPDVFPWME